MDWWTEVARIADVATIAMFLAIIMTFLVSRIGNRLAGRLEQWAEVLRRRSDA